VRILRGYPERHHGIGPDREPAAQARSTALDDQQRRRSCSHVERDLLFDGPDGREDRRRADARAERDTDADLSRGIRGRRVRRGAGVDGFEPDGCAGDRGAEGIPHLEDERARQARTHDAALSPAGHESASRGRRRRRPRGRRRWWWSGGGWDGPLRMRHGRRGGARAASGRCRAPRTLFHRREHRSLGAQPAQIAAVALGGIEGEAVARHELRQLALRQHRTRQQPYEIALAEWREPLAHEEHGEQQRHGRRHPDASKRLSTLSTRA
jgi:hypothetical protein